MTNFTVQLILLQTLTEEFKFIFVWYKTSYIPLNIIIFQIISFIRSKIPIIFKYNINNNELNRVYVMNKHDLGINFKNYLSFKINH